MKKNVMSLFDGMSCCQIALKELGIKVDNYYASEIDERAIQVTQHNFPKTIQIGDVRFVNTRNFKDIYILAGGSPCTDLSLAGTRGGVLCKSSKEYEKLRKSGYDFGDNQSYLIWEYIRMVKKLKPKYFILENVILSGEFKYLEDIISKELGVLPIRINSSKLSSQNRDRLYWTNIPGITQPEDKGIKCTHVIRGGYGCGIRGRKEKGDKKYKMYLTVRTDLKFNCLVTSPYSTNRVFFKNGTHRKITVREAELIQTIPPGYTNVKGISDTAKYHMIGNGWTIEVIKHLFKNLKKTKTKV